MNRRLLLQYLASVAPASGVLPVHAQEAAYPIKPIRFIIASTTGGGLDAVSRMYADKMSAYMKQPFVPDNIGGAASMIAARQLISAQPDGYTLMTASNTIVTIPHLNAKAGFAVKDFTPIGEMCRSPELLVVSTSSPFKAITELVAAAKKAPGHISFASGGVGTTTHLPAEMFAKQAGITVTHVPFKGVAQAVPDVVSGRVNFMVVTPTSVDALIKSGALRPLAVTSDTRSLKYPAVPTFKELGYPEATFDVWFSVLAPSGLPKAIRAKLGDAMEAARADQNLIRQIDGMGQVISNVRTPQQCEAVFLAAEKQASKLIQEANIVLE